MEMSMPATGLMERETGLVDWRRPRVRTPSTVADTSMTKNAVMGSMMTG